MYPEYFASLSASEVAMAFIEGVRFDAAVIMIPFGVIALMIVFPFKWKRLWMWIAFAIYPILAIVLITDVIYFGNVKRHLANEIKFLSNEVDFAISMLNEYASTLFIIVVVLIICAVFWHKLSQLPDKYDKLTALKIFLVVLISFAMIRGTFTAKPISTIDAFRGGAVQGNLIVNGIFSMYKYSSHARKPVKTPYTIDEASVNLGIDNSVQYPLLKGYEGKPSKKNIVIIVLESWSAYYVGALGSKFNVTPNFDNLSRNGALFVNHYAPEKRSIDGLQAILTGIPVVPGEIPSLGFGLEIKATGNIGTIAGKNGYDTIFMQTSARRSYYMDAISRSLGFKRYYGMEDYPIVFDYPDSKSSVFGWDYDAMAFLNEQIDGEGNFLAILFTGTTHTPYPELNAPFNQEYNTERDEESAYLNTLAYSDFSLGRFIEAESKSEWFKDTIYIITADHTAGKYEDVKFPLDYHVPLLIYSPDNVAAGRFEKITTHVDIMPTVMELSGIAGGIAVAGSSVFDDETPGRAIIKEGETVGIVKDSGWVKVLDSTIIDSSGEGLEELAKEALSYQQVMNTLIDQNRWCTDGI
jgi:phosphoglycerol transferase MdoB-like AlkP superfamily enzyme